MMGYKIKDRRKQLGLSQEELSRRSGVSRSIISALESGKERITTTKTLLRLADALETTVDVLFFGKSV